jgi:hypothetical protein
VGRWVGGSVGRWVGDQDRFEWDVGISRFLVSRLGLRRLGLRRRLLSSTARRSSVAYQLPDLLLGTTFEPA